MSLEAASEYETKVRRARGWWISVAVGVRLLLLIAFVSLLRSQGVLESGRWMLEGGDSFSYLGSADNLVDHGLYGYDLRRPETWAGRMPGYAFLYVPLRLLLPREQALDACAILQASAGGVAAYYLALALLMVTSSRWVFLATYWLGLLATYVASWDYRALTESPAASTTVMLAYGTLLALRERRLALTFVAGFSAAWSVFLKPAFLPLVAVAAAPLLIGLRRRGSASAARVIVHGVVFLAPLVIADGAWVARNWSLYGRFIPLQFDENAGYSYTRSFLALVRLMKAWGADYVAWNPRAEIRWFDPQAGLLRRDPVGYAPPPGPEPPAFRHAFTSCYGRSDMLQLRQTYLRAHDPQVSVEQRLGADEDATATLEWWRSCFVRERPFRYWVAAPLRLAGIALIHSGTYNLFPVTADRLSRVALFAKVVQSAIYLWTVVIGIPTSVVWLLVSLLRREGPGLLLASIPVYFGLFFPLVLGRAEYRYFVVGFPFALACAVLCVHVGLSWVRCRLAGAGL